MKRIALALTLVLLLPAAASAVYVSDNLQITLRSGPGTKYQVLKTLESGDELAALGEESDGWIKVRYGDLQGWVLQRFTSREPIHRVQLERARSRLERLETQNAELQSTTAELKTLRSDLEGQVQRLTTENERMIEQLGELQEVASRPIAIEERNQQLTARVVALEEELSLVQTENRDLRDNRQRDWFLAGAGVMVVGVLLGLLLPRLRRQRSMFR